MFEVPINKDKQHFMDYLLFQYQFKSRITVWILNYLKANDSHVKFVKFVDEINPQHTTLEISVENSQQDAIRLTFNQNIYINTNKIFTLIVEDIDQLDIKIHFSHPDYRDTRLDFIILHQLFSHHVDESYIYDLKLIHLNSTTYQHLMHLLESQIDLSLRVKNPDAFKWYTHLLSVLKLRRYKFYEE
ncbi:YpiB family protein [Staphylococcus chromogenes]|uniref:YpiB family protein n=1 Tax=Staphylococcus chromogenes TaxID=46126 RepID=UPI000D1B068C|nr:YpiB family protein [Staphylococcus chromogenes]MCE5042427.1 YpiB family protein [Staphylococcus chromogenes]MDT0654616.1 YpiB family protein [Staphylococcus chromogenes]MDT0670999.1 YpiB family protein [Staphylococcus chromogenes]MDT0673191.1 YpiB family protein [Staphylococcus chromogenes]MDT0679982.1 YpiB family protein [Staphylococcus chromogenes]